MSSKKGKKNKGMTLSLQDFNAKLEDGHAPNSGQNVVYASKKPSAFTTNWAEEMDEEELITEKERILLPSAPRASRGPNVDDNQIPRSPPFTAHLSNVAYEIGDEDMYNFFHDLKIVSVRIPRDLGNKPKGYAYIDFENREDLISAIAMSDQQLKGRNVRITIGEGHNLRRDAGQGRGSGGGGYTDATPSDWRSGMGSSSPPRRDAGGFSDFRRGNDFNRGGDFERGRDRGFGGSEMTRDQMSGGHRDGFNDFPSERGDRDHFSRDRSGSNEMDSSWRNERVPQAQQEAEFYRSAYGGDGGGRQMDYGGVRTRDDQPRVQDQRDRGYYDRGQQRQHSPPRGGGGYDDRRGGYDERRGYDEDRGRRGYNVGNRTSRENSPPATRNTAAPQPPEQSNEPQRERKKLVLAPRTVKTQIDEPAPETSSAIFGGAKPVDTAAREKEIEEKILSLDIRSTRVRSDSHADEPRIRILQRTPEERDRRDRELKYERERRQRERYPSTSEKAKELLHRHTIPEELPKSLQSRRSPNAVPSVASSFHSESFHPNNNSPTSKHLQRNEDDDEGSTKSLERNELVQTEIIEPLKNPWSNRKDIRDEEVQRRPVYESDRKTPDFDRNSEKEKDTNSDPEDDRDSHHRFINEDNVAKDDDDDEDFCKVPSRSRGRRDREDRGFKDDGTRGDRRGGARGGAHYSAPRGGSGGYGGPRPVDSSGVRRGGERADYGGPRREPYGRAGGDAGSTRRGGYGGGPPSRER